MDLNNIIQHLIKDGKEIVAADETGVIARHFENCPRCGSQNTLKVYECIFETWSQVEISCSVCQYLERVINKANTVNERRAKYEPS